MTDIVEEARALLAQATPGPWRYATNGLDRMVVGGPVVVREFIGTPYETGTFIVGGEQDEGSVDEDDPNIKLIIAAPSLLAALADECERLRAELADAQRIRSEAVSSFIAREEEIDRLNKRITHEEAKNARLRDEVPTKAIDVLIGLLPATLYAQERNALSAVRLWLIGLSRLDTAKEVR